MAGCGYLDVGVYVACSGEYCTENTAMIRRVIESMDHPTWVADQYNNSGHEFELPRDVPRGPADPDYPQSDPTDPTDSAEPLAASAISTESGAAPAPGNGKGKGKSKK
jgi:hypothetical protein